MFDGKYFDWNQKRIKGIVDHYGYKFFYGKKIADLGCGYADLSGTLYRLGAEITAVDARQEHLKIVSKKFPGIKVVRSNLEGPWPFFSTKFDMVLDLGLVCHLASYEEHLKAVCASTTYLVLETAVCDSDDPNKCIQIAEGKDSYDLSFNGGGCRPSSAAIERVLAECGMSFKRIDSPKFNSGEYIYDWIGKNDETTSIYKRRMWFAVKNIQGVTQPYIGAQPAVVVQPPAAPTFNFGTPDIPSHFTTSIQGSGVPTVLSASARPPMSARIAAEGLQHPGLANPYTSSNYTESKPSQAVSPVRINSKEFSLVTPENYEAPSTFMNSGTILPNTPSSRLWIRKIAPFFPELKVSSRAFTMFDFKQSSDDPDVIMCSLDTLIAGKRIWIEEWFDRNLTHEQIEILRKCKTIMSPSLVNTQEILKVIPEANVIRVEKVWPMIPCEAIKHDYILYFEKEEEITNTLLAEWDEKFGKLIVVGSRLKLPKFAESVTDTSDYMTVCTLLMGAKALLDLSGNNYYKSGLIQLASSLSLPVITNNQSYLNLNNTLMVKQDKTRYPTSENIRTALNKFILEHPKTPAKYNSEYNKNLQAMLEKLVGVQC